MADKYIAPASWDINTYALAHLGTAAGTGTITDPWDLYTGLRVDTLLAEGETLWIRGGTYFFNGSATGYVPSFINNEFFKVSLHGNGTSHVPVYVKNYPCEWVKIDGNLTGSTGGPIATFPDRRPTILHLRNAAGVNACHDIVFMTSTDADGNNNPKCFIEVFSSDTLNRNVVIAPPDLTGPPYSPTNAPYGESDRADFRNYGIDIKGANISVLNIVVHDTGEGIGNWASAPDCTVSGIVYCNGIDATNDGVSEAANGLQPYVLALGSGTACKAYWAMEEHPGAVTIADTSAYNHPLLTGITGITFGAIPVVGRSVEIPSGSGASGAVSGGGVTPITITTKFAHGLIVGDYVYVQGVLGNTAANGLFPVATTPTLTTFTVSATGNGTYDFTNSVGVVNLRTSAAFDGTTNAYATAAHSTDLQLPNNADWMIIVNAQLASRRITVATNTSPISITTSAAHLFETNDYVHVWDVGNNADGIRQITKTGATTFTLNSSTGAAFTVTVLSQCVKVSGQTIIAKGDGNFTSSQEYALQTSRFYWLGQWWNFGASSYAQSFGDHKAVARRSLTILAYKHSQTTLRLFEGGWLTSTITSVSGSYDSTSQLLYVGKAGAADTSFSTLSALGHVAIVKGSTITTNAEATAMNLLARNGGRPSYTSNLGRKAGHGMYLQAAATGAKIMRDIWVWGNFGDGFHADGESTDTRNNAIGPISHFNDRFLMTRASGFKLVDTTVTKAYTWESPLEMLGAKSLTGETGCGCTNSIMTSSVHQTTPQLDLAGSNNGLTDFNFQGNVVYPINANQPCIRHAKTNAGVNSSFHYGDTTPNTYYVQNAGANNFTSSGAGQTFTQWKATEYPPGTVIGWDASSTLTTTVPSTATVKAELNADDTGLGMIVIFNWQGDDFVTIPDARLRGSVVSGGLNWASTDTIKIATAQNFLADTVYNGQVGTSGIVIDMRQASRPLYTPIGDDLGTWASYNSFPFYGSLVAYRTAPGTPPPPNAAVAMNPYFRRRTA